MPSIAFDLGYLNAGIQEIESFLLTKNIFWPISSPSPVGESRYPRMTLGGLLLSLFRLKARSLPPTYDVKFRSLEKELDRWRIKWLTSWEWKASIEFKSRLRQWRNYLDEMDKRPDLNIPFYKSEVRVRVLLELLKKEINSQDDQEINNLSLLDGILRSIFVPGDFIWDNELTPGFNQRVFWYLWGYPDIQVDLE
jgi:hypothetical protein